MKEAAAALLGSFGAPAPAPAREASATTAEKETPVEGNDVVADAITGESRADQADGWPEDRHDPGDLSAQGYLSPAAGKERTAPTIKSRRGKAKARNRKGRGHSA